MSVGKLEFFLSFTMLSAVVTSLIVNIYLFKVVNQLNEQLDELHGFNGELMFSLSTSVILPPISASKQSPEVQEYLNQHPTAQWRVLKTFVKADGNIYLVYKDWIKSGWIGKVLTPPKDGKNHYCWRVRWWWFEQGILDGIDVFVDKDSLEIVLMDPQCHS